MKWDFDSVRFLTSISMKWEEIANLFGVSTHKKSVCYFSLDVLCCSSTRHAKIFST